MSWAIFVAVAAPLVAMISTLLVYSRSRKVDAASERTGIATESRAGQAQINEGQQDLITLLQADNKVLREEFNEMKVEVQKLTREVNRLYRKYGENGNGVKSA